MDLLLASASDWQQTQEYAHFEENTTKAAVLQAYTRE